MPDKAEEIVDAIIYDMSDRSGLGNEYDAIDDQTKDELRNTWIEIVRTKLK